MITAATHTAVNLYTPAQLNVSLDSFIQVKEDNPPVQAPYKAETKQTVAIRANIFETGA
jgi:hypothetical protein